MSVDLTIPRKPCEADGCLTEVPWDRSFCFYCWKTLKIMEEEDRQAAIQAGLNRQAEIIREQRHLFPQARLSSEDRPAALAERWAK